MLRRQHRQAEATGRLQRCPLPALCWRLSYAAHVVVANMDTAYRWYKRTCQGLVSMRCDNRSVPMVLDGQWQWCWMANGNGSGWLTRASLVTDEPALSRSIVWQRAINEHQRRSVVLDDTKIQIGAPTNFQQLRKSVYSRKCLHTSTRARVCVCARARVQAVCAWSCVCACRLCVRGHVCIGV